MKRGWKIRREMVHYPDGQRRWDLTYQKLLEWSQQEETRKKLKDCPGKERQNHE